MRAPRFLRRARANVRYRAGQFFRGLHARLSPSEIASVRSLLSPAELRLFLAMEPRDRRHSMDVLRWLEVTAGSDKPSEALRKAALLHDVGKGRMRVWDRVAYVLMEGVSPRLVDFLGSPERPEPGAGGGTRWRRALWRLRHHAELSARVLSEAGTDQQVVALVAAHIGDRPGAAAAASSIDPELARLVEADRVS
jgi:putative nucleotidyltransferase with HDIG domain